MTVSRGTVLLTGVVLFAFGLCGLLVNADFPRDQFADGTVQGQSWVGFEVNGWTNFFALCGGGALLLGGANQITARVAGVLVAAASAACCTIALIDGDDVLGLAAANWATKLGFGVVAGVLLVASLLPSRLRRHRAVAVETHEHVEEQPILVDEPSDEPTRAAPVAESGPRGARPTTVRRRPGLRARVRDLTHR